MNRENVVIFLGALMWGLCCGMTELAQQRQTGAWWVCFFAWLAVIGLIYLVTRD